MENKSDRGNPTPKEASAWLNDAEVTRATLAREIKTPSWFFTSIGTAISVQIATMGVGVADPSPWTLSTLAAGIVVLLAVAGVQLARFRRLNGIWLGGLLSRVVLGTENLASIAYGVAGGGAILAAFYSHWWLTLSWAIIGGAAYALSGRRWLRAYRTTPGVQTRGESLAWVILATVAALAGLGLLLLGH